MRAPKTLGIIAASIATAAAILTASAAARGDGAGDGAPTAQAEQVRTPPR